MRRAPLSVLAGLSGLLSRRPALAAELDTLQPLSLGALLEVIVGLALVLALFMGVAYLLRRISSLRGGVPSHDMRIVAGLSLSTRDRIVLLEVRRHQILLGLSPGSIRALHVFPPEHPVPSQSGAFEGRLQEQLAETAGAPR